MESPLMMRLHPCHFSPHGIIRSILRCGFLENAAIRRKAMKQKTDNLIRALRRARNDPSPRKGTFRRARSEYPPISECLR